MRLGSGKLTSCDLSWRLSLSSFSSIRAKKRAARHHHNRDTHFLFGIKPILLLFQIDLMDICGSNIVVLTWYPISWDLSPGPYHLCESNIFLLLLYVRERQSKRISNSFSFRYIFICWREEGKQSLRELTGNFRFLFLFLFFFQNWRPWNNSIRKIVSTLPNCWFIVEYRPRVLERLHSIT